MSTETWRSWRRAELRYTPNTTVIRGQQLSSESRFVIINWLMEVAAEAELKQNTIQLAVNYMDRFFAVTQTIPNELYQTVACAALYLASKIEASIINYIHYLTLKLRREMRWTWK